MKHINLAIAVMSLLMNPADVQAACQPPRIEVYPYANSSVGVGRNCSIHVLVPTGSWGIADLDPSVLTLKDADDQAVRFTLTVADPSIAHMDIEGWSDGKCSRETVQVTYEHYLLNPTPLFPANSRLHVEGAGLEERPEVNAGINVGTAEDDSYCGGLVQPHPPGCAECYGHPVATTPVQPSTEPELYERGGCSVVIAQPVAAEQVSALLVGLLLFVVLVFRKTSRV